MKFARYLEATQTPEWKRAYIDYRFLKKRINAIRKGQGGHGGSSSEDVLSDDEPKAPIPPLSPTTVRFSELPPDLERHYLADSEAISRRHRRSSFMTLAKSFRHSMQMAPKRFSVASSRSPPLTLQDILPQLAPIELDFFIALDAELDKIEKFYQAREAELEARGRALREQLEDHATHKSFLQGFYSGPRTWTAALISKLSGRSIHTVKPNARSRHDGTVDWDNIELSMRATFDKGKRKGTEDQEEGAIPIDDKRIPMKRDFSSDPGDFLQAKKKLKKAALEHYRGLELLYNYRILNMTGFRKALKKYEKTTHIPAQEAYMTERIGNSAIASDRGLRTMIDEMESLYTVIFAGNDRKRAKDRLKGGSLAKSHHSSSFMSGIFLGLAVPLLVAGIWSAQQDSTRKAIPAWNMLLLAYGVLAIPVIFSVFVGLNVIVWARYRINYPFIFELDTRASIDYREYFEIPTLLAVTLCSAFWLSFFRIGSDSIQPFMWPLVWLGFLLVMMGNPLPFFSRPSRYWFLRSVGQLFLSGSRRVEYTDFWLADQLCSFGFTFSNLSLLACVYAEDFHPHGDDCSITGRFWMISYVISSLPLLVRLIQSVKRYVDSGLISHLINGGKYAFGLISSAFYYVWRNNGTTARGPAFTLWVLTNIIYSLYAAGWDCLMDWSLLRLHCKYPFLREELIYTDSIPLYYFSIISNIIIRFSWIWYIPQRGPDLIVRAFVIGMLEMFRRWQWNFYRLENEHLGNVDQYRVTREVPLPYTFAAEEDDDDAEDREMLHLRRTSFIHKRVPNTEYEDGEDSNATQLRPWSSGWIGF